MADTALERIKLEQEEEKASKDIQESRKEKQSIPEFQQAFLNAITQIQEDASEPKKPVRYGFNPFSKKGRLEKGDVTPETLSNIANPTKMLIKSLLPGEIDGKKKPAFYNINTFVREAKGQKEKEYISGLDEIAKGLETGSQKLSHSLISLLTIPTDFAFNTNFTEGLEKAINDKRIKADEPETWRGEITSLGVQYGIAGGVISKFLTRTGKLDKIAKLLKADGVSKASKVYRRALEGATVLGATDFLASDPGRDFGLIVTPKSTKGLTGRKKAAAEFINKVKFGVEGTILGGGFPLIGKAIQKTIYKPVFNPLLKGGAKIGVKGIGKVYDASVYILNAKAIQPGVEATAKTFGALPDWLLTKAIGPTVVSAFSGKVVRQLPPFEQWRLFSKVSPTKELRSIKSFDNFLSVFRSFGKNPKSIEGVSEQAELFIKSKARRLDRLYEGLEKTAYNLAKQFEKRYNGNNTSKAGEKYYLDEVLEFMKGQKPLSALEKDLQPLAKDLRMTVTNILKDFRKTLPKNKQADDVILDLKNSLSNNIDKYIVRSFSLFSNPTKVVAQELKDNAAQWIKKNVIAKSWRLKEMAASAKAFSNIKDKQLAYAETMVEDILNIGRAEGKDPIRQLKTIGQKILRDKKYKFLKTGEELPKPIRQLLGEENNLKASILYTTTQALASAANKKALDAIAKIGLKEGWLFRTAEEARPVYTTAEQITKIPKLGKMTTDLTDLYTSPELAQMFKGQGGRLDQALNGLLQYDLYKNIIATKAIIQGGKTLYSPTTQVRNVTSASFFALFNGHVGHRASVIDAMRMVKRDIFSAGKGIDEKQFNDYIEKLIRLGVLDENIVAQELRAVFRDLKDGQIRNQSDLLSRLAKMTPTDKVARLYAGGDNLWKDFGYNFSKSQFSDVVTNLDEVAEMFKYLGKNWDPINVQTGVKKTLDDGLDEIAAYMIRNTYPTYSKVPPAIQTLRKFPLGNFVSFPAEIIRTGANSITTHLKLAAHPNKAVRQIGLRGLTGAFLTTYGFGKAATEMFYYLSDTTEAQWDAYKRSGAADWNKTSNLLALSKWKNGVSSAVNFSYFSPYDVLNEPLQAAILQAQRQKLNPKETEEYVFNLMFSGDGPIAKLLEPFISEPLGFDRFRDVTTRSGRKEGGGRVYTEADELGERVAKSFAYVIDGIKPGFMTTGGKILSAAQQDLTKGGRPTNLVDEIIKLFSGVSIIRIDAKEDLGYSATTMNRLLRDVDETSDFYSTKSYKNNTPGVLVESFEDMQDEAFKLQKNMFISIQDMKLLDISSDTIEEILIKRGVNKKLASNLMDGVFTPVNYSKARFENKVNYIKKDLKARNLDDEYYYYVNESFVFPEDKLDAVKDRYEDRKFFNETFNPDKGQYEGGYYPEREGYKTDRKGFLILDDKGNPVIEKGLIKKGMEGIGGLKERALDFTIPGRDIYKNQSTAPATNNTAPVKVATAQPQINQIDGLTGTERAVLSPTEQEIARRT